MYENVTLVSVLPQYFKYSVVSVVRNWSHHREHFEKHNIRGMSLVCETLKEFGLGLVYKYCFTIQLESQFILSKVYFQGFKAFKFFPLYIF